MASITIRSVSKAFGPTRVLESVDLAIASGEFVVLVGPSGCGKSTLLRLIAGLEDLSAGSIEIDGRRVDDLAPKDRDIAMVFQSYALYPHMSVRDNMSYALRLRRQPAEAIAAAVSRASAMLGLGAYQERRPRALSGGQRQRVAMGRAIVRTPKAFLFDEPLSNLDARLREQMRFEIRKLHRDLGATSVYVTHDQIEAMTMADRIVAMEGGVIQQVGTPLELYDDPVNTFVAGFIGSPAMNFIEAVAEPDQEGVRLKAGGVTLASLPAPWRGVAAGPVMLGVRPERLALTPPGPEGAVMVDLVEPTGLGTVVHLSLAGTSLKLFTTARPALNPGQAVGVRIAAEDVRLFRIPDGARLRAA